MLLIWDEQTDGRESLIESAYHFAEDYFDNPRTIIHFKPVNQYEAQFKLAGGYQTYTIRRKGKQVKIWKER